jgi:hypothetical protein
MRVAISYSTEIEDVPTEIDRLLMFTERPDIQRSLKEISELVLENDCINAMNKITQLRKELGILDYRLRDFGSIISGYVNAVIEEEPNESETSEG